MVAELVVWKELDVAATVMLEVVLSVEVVPEILGDMVVEMLVVVVVELGTLQSITVTLCSTGSQETLISSVV